MINRQFCTMVLLLLLSMPALTQEYAVTIVGKVTSTDNRPLENVSISLLGTHYGALTNESGDFTFAGPEGQYTLVISSLDHELHTIKTNLKNGKNNFNVVLELKENNLNEVVVEGNIEKFSNKESNHVARMPLRNLENPQVYSVISKDLIKEQIIINFDDVLKNTSGVDKLWSSTGRGGDGASYFSLRGFASQPTMVNGLGGQTNGGLDAANIERVEVLKGPSGTLFGSSLVSFGGLINVVTKKPYAYRGGEIAYTMGSYGLNRVAADINTPLNENNDVLLRTNAAYQYESSFQDVGFHRTFFLAPSLSYKANDKMSFSFDAEFYSSEGTNNTMIFLARGRALEYNTPKELGLSYKRTFSSDDLTIKTPTVKVSGVMDYKLSNKWKSQTAVSTSNRQSKGIYAYNMFLDAVKDDSISREIGSVDSKTITVDIQQNFIGDFKIGSLRNRLVVGADFFNTKTRESSNYTSFDKVAARGYDANYATLNKEAALAKIAESTPYKSENSENTYSVYFSDVLNVSKQLLVMTSLRFDHFSNNGYFDPASGETSGQYSQNAFSPKLGLVYQILPDKLSVFANYMNGFENVPPASADGITRVYKPRQANQIEGGFKASLFNNKLIATVSYYDIYVKNILLPDPDNIKLNIQKGNMYSRGVEIDITANPIQGLSLIAGYSYNDSKNEKTGGDAEGLRPVGAGAKNLINAWASYTLTSGIAKGFGFGFGGNYASENAITNDLSTGKFTLPAYTIFNATAFYTTKGFHFGLKIDNIANKQYWKGWTTIEPQKLRQVIGTVSFQF